MYQVDHGHENRRPSASPPSHSSYILGTALNSRHLFTGGWDKNLIWWDRETGKAVRKQKAHGKWLRGVEVSPCGKQLATVSDDMVCRIWSTETGSLLAELKGHEAQTPNNYPSMLFCARYSPDGSRLATDKVATSSSGTPSRSSPCRPLMPPGITHGIPPRGGTPSVACETSRFHRTANRCTPAAFTRLATWITSGPRRGQRFSTSRPVNH